MIIDKERADEYAPSRAEIRCRSLSGDFFVRLDNGSTLGSVNIANNRYTTSIGDQGSLIEHRDIDGNVIPGWYSWVEPPNSTFAAAKNYGVLWCDARGVWHWSELLGPQRS